MIGELKNKKEGENKETKDPGIKNKIEKDIELIERQKAQIEKKKII